MPKVEFIRERGACLLLQIRCGASPTIAVPEEWGEDQRVRLLTGYSLSRVSNDLTVRPDPDHPTKHAFIEPAEIVPLETYETSIAKMRPGWRKAWP